MFLRWQKTAVLNRKKPVPFSATAAHSRPFAQLPKNKFEWNLSPEVTEELLKTEVGLKNPWPGESGLLFFRLLTEEITRQTPFVAVAHPWKHYSSTSARIEFRQKLTNSTNDYGSILSVT